MPHPRSARRSASTCARDSLAEDAPALVGFPRACLLLPVTRASRRRWLAGGGACLVLSPALAPRGDSTRAQGARLRAHSPEREREADVCRAGTLDVCAQYARVCDRGDRG